MRHETVVAHPAFRDEPAESRACVAGVAAGRPISQSASVQGFRSAALQQVPRGLVALGERRDLTCPEPSPCLFAARRHGQASGRRENLHHEKRVYYPGRRVLLCQNPVAGRAGSPLPAGCRINRVFFPHQQITRS